MHVTWLGLTSANDWTLVRLTADDGFVFVTNNMVHFTTLYGRESLHIGLVCLNAAPGSISLDLQRQLSVLAKTELGGSGTLQQSPGDHVIHGRRRRCQAV